MSNNIDIKTLEAFQDGNHKAFETVFIAYYNKTKAFIDGYIKSESDAEELTEDLFVNLWINHDSIDASKSFSSSLSFPGLCMHHAIFSFSELISFTLQNIPISPLFNCSPLFISPFG